MTVIATTTAADDLRQARIRAGLLQRQLASMIGCHPKTVAKIERGQHSPRPELVQAWLAACDRLAPNQVAPDPDPTPPPPPAEISAGGEAEAWIEEGARLMRARNAAGLSRSALAGALQLDYRVIVAVETGHVRLRSDSTKTWMNTCNQQNDPRLTASGLAQARLQAGLTQQELANKLRVSLSTIYFAERGSKRPRRRTANAWLLACETSRSPLLTPESYRPDYLRAARLAAGLSQSALALLAGVSPTTVHAVERGDYTAKRNTVLKWLAACEQAKNQTTPPPTEPDNAD